MNGMTVLDVLQMVLAFTIALPCTLLAIHCATCRRRLSE